LNGTRLFKIKIWDLAEGSNLDKGTVQLRKCDMGQTVAENLFKDGKSDG
jgi:hypothetical protein